MTRPRDSPTGLPSVAINAPGENARRSELAAYHNRNATPNQVTASMSQ